MQKKNMVGPHTLKMSIRSILIERENLNNSFDIQKITWLKFTPHYFLFTRIFLCIIVEIGFARNQNNRSQWPITFSVQQENE
jgi:hypothetical protein